MTIGGFYMVVGFLLIALLLFKNYLDGKTKKEMDSLIETKKINMLTTSFHSNFDSFQLSRFFYSDTHLYYGANSNYKFNIQFGINRELEIYNFIYDDGKECDSYGRGAYGVECWCPYINCDVNTTNCKKLNTKQLYISPQ